MLSIVEGIVVVAVIVLLLAALYWEYLDYKRLSNRPPINSLSTDAQTSEAIFYGCFNAENHIAWRSIYIATVIIVFIFWFIFSQMKMTLPFWLYVVMGLVIFLTFYLLNQYRTFHLYRVMCSKVRPDLPIL